MITKTIKTPAEVLDMVREKKLDIVDFKFTDLPGTLQHFSIPAGELDESIFRDGIGFDGSSIRGFQAIHESDMLLVPDPTTAHVDAICRRPPSPGFGYARDPLTREKYWRDPRYIAQKAEAHLLSTGLADTAYFGPEAEFFIFDNVRFDQNPPSGYYFMDSEEGIWNSGKEGQSNLGYRPRYKEGYFPTAPTDSLQDLRSEAVLKMIQAGIDIEVHHHEVATAGQGEIDMRFQRLTRMADQVLLYKYILKNVARAHNKTVTFMPKPLFGDNGSGMHVHISLWKGGNNLFFDPEGYAQLSITGMHFIGGLLAHSPALLAFCAPTTNSYRRLVPGYEAPGNPVYSPRTPPVYPLSPRTKRIESRPPDPSCNPYLAFPALLMAGLDGIKKEMDPGFPMGVDIYELE